MNDKEQKYIEIAKKLLQQEDINTYTVISDSMKPLIKKGDKIVCVKKDFGSLKKYQIIAFKNNIPGKKDIPVVHRIIEKKHKEDVCYRTKGDNSLYTDKELVFQEHFIGVVDKIIKENRTINLNTKTGRIISLVACFLFCIKNFFKLVFININKFFVMCFRKETSLVYDDDLLMLRQVILTQTKDWQTIVKNDTELLNPFIQKDKKICDFSFGGGYCEESFNFIRKGINIEYKNLDTKDKNDFDVIICSRVINIVENKQKRQVIYDTLKTFIKKDGTILLSYINEKNNVFVALKRKIYNFFSKKYDGPLSDDIVYEDNCFIMKNLPFKVVYDELINCGFVIKNFKKTGKVISFLLQKKC
ncbi:MAG: signal peptidase I [Elusimicrobia bacterium]|nr:signal peptidase I [Elusimicrobiota bacterium]